MVTESMLAVPPAVVPVTRILLVPAVRGTEMDAVAQVSQLAVTGKFSVPREVPLTEMVAGRAAVVPSENRKVRVLAFRLELVPFMIQDGPENITTVTPLSTPPVVPLLGMPSSWAAFTDASPSSRESLSEVVWLFAVCVSPKIEPMHLPL